jgi:hypothetical protein
MVDMARVLLLVALCLTSLSRAADGPTIQGWLRSEDGMPVAGEVQLVQYDIPCSPSPSGSPWCGPGVDYWVVTDAEGRFETKVLEPHIYWVSAIAGRGLLRSASWGDVSQLFQLNLKNGKSIRDLVITLRRAATLIVRVNDPLELLPIQGARLSGSRLTIGVFTLQGGYYVAFEGPRDAAGALDYSLSIPYGVPLTLWVLARDIKVTDESGTQINTSGPNTLFTVPAFTCTKRFVLNVSPLRAAQ